MKNDKLLLSTVPSRPDFNKYIDFLKLIWESKVFTNNGFMVKLLEQELQKYLNSHYPVVLANGTAALQLAVKTLNIKGEVITSPFTYIGTVRAINWGGATHRFADINPETFNIDPKKIEEQINKRTEAIMPIHIFSNPVEITAIEKLAAKYNLKVIYDAAHAYGVKYNGKSILNYGDISSISFNATKLLSTGEGGACFCKDNALQMRLRRLRNFGFNEKMDITDDGFNVKMSEIHAALGLVNIKMVDSFIKKRKNNFLSYQCELEPVLKSGKIRFQHFNPDEYNYSYMPIVFCNSDSREKVEIDLMNNNIMAKKYFYPPLNKINGLETNGLDLKNSENLSKNILCLPTHCDITEENINQISNIIKNNLKS